MVLTFILPVDSPPEQVRMKTIALVTRTLAAAVVAVSAPKVIADFSDDFSSQSLANYNLYNPLTGFGTPASFGFPGTGLQITVPQSVLPAQLGPGRAGAFVNGQSYGNVAVSFDILNSSTGKQYAGAFVETGTLSIGQVSGYTVGYDYSANQFLIAKVVGEVTQGSIGPTASSGVLALTPGNVLHVDYSDINGQQFATLTDKTTGKVLASVSGFDSTFTRGSIGLGVAIQSAQAGLTATSTFGNFSVTALSVPEPSTWALAAVGLGALAWSARQRRV